MSVSKYKFVSPGVFIKEIDNSALPAEPIDIGPLVIGRTARGPGMRPVRVTSFSEFIDTFGNPEPGAGGDDVWRNNSILAPTYAAYAAQAWLANNSPINVIRLLGREHTNRTSAGRAGWMTKNSDGAETRNGATTKNAITVGGAFGLFLINSSSEGAAWSYAANTRTQKDKTPQTGTLAAVWYVNEGTINLSGTIRGGQAIGGVNQTSSNAVLIESRGAYHEFVAEIKDNTNSRTDLIAFNFDEKSPKFIRKVFNTNPSLTNTAVTRTAQQKNYWLGESFERFLLHGDGEEYAGVGAGSATTGSTYGVILGLQNTDTAGTENAWSSRRHNLQSGKSGWVVAQDTGLPEDFNPHTLPKLFRFCTFKSGVADMQQIKISITDIKKSTNLLDKYGTFTVLVRKVEDQDGKLQIVERFSNCNLNPASPNYLGRKIGDKYIDFSSSERRNVEYGQYENRSKFVRVEMNEDLDEGGMDPVLLPFGCHFPNRAKRWSYVAETKAGGTPAPLTFGEQMFGGDDAPANNPSGIAKSFTTTALVTGSRAIQDSATFGGAGATLALRANGNEVFIVTGPHEDPATNARSNFASGSFTGSFVYPGPAIRSGSGDDGLKSLKECFWGYQTGKSATNPVFDPSNFDVFRALPENLNTYTHTAITGDTGTGQLETGMIFTLDNVVSSSNGGGAHYASGSRAGSRAGTDSQDESISKAGYEGKVGYEAVLEFGINKFTLPIFGGIDGFDITEKDPFRNDSAMAADTSDEKTNYAFNSVKEAIDMVADAETLDFNLAAIPGVYTKALTGHLIDTVEDRGDALAVIDLEGDFKPASESTDNYKTRIDNAKVSTVVNNLRDRELNSSYGCAYFPWVQIYDSISDRLVYVPPTVAAIGTMSNSEAQSELWFAPAGFNRGGLSGGAAGVPVVGITQKLTSDQRDELYDANINPIASFPAEGIVVFGQKTLQVTPSALDRINVRRLMIFLKKRVSQIASTILFDQNVEVTWNRFIGQVDPFLSGVKTAFGLSDYKIVLDSSTTTPDLVDRNILYAKIFLKPARAIEYIAIDFNISRTGAAFED